MKKTLFDIERRRIGVENHIDFKEPIVAITWTLVIWGLNWTFETFSPDWLSSIEAFALSLGAKADAGSVFYTILSFVLGLPLLLLRGGAIAIMFIVKYGVRWIALVLCVLYVLAWCYYKLIPEDGFKRFYMRLFKPNDYFLYYYDQKNLNKDNSDVIHKVTPDGKALYTYRVRKGSVYNVTDSVDENGEHKPKLVPQNEDGESTLSDDEIKKIEDEMSDGSTKFEQWWK